MDKFDCCSRFKQCSDANKCVNPYPELEASCNYKTKIENGEILLFRSKVNITVNSSDVIAQLKTFPHMKYVLIDDSVFYVKELVKLINYYVKNEFDAIKREFDRQWLYQFRTLSVYIEVFERLARGKYEIDKIFSVVTPESVPEVIEISYRELNNGQLGFLFN